MTLWDGKYQNQGRLCQPARPDLVDRLLAALAPWHCCLCRQPSAGMDLCIDCLNDLPWTGLACSRCAEALISDAVCGRCLADPPPQAAALAALRYEFPVRPLIAALKYRQQPSVARVLGELLAIRIREAVHAENTAWPDCIIPVPLHPWRRYRRGFNQAELIAGYVAKDTGVPLESRCLKRVVNTPSQTALRKSARTKNIRNSFFADPALAGRHIALVDDVITTGATVGECARVLLRAGASRVQVWAVARV